MPKKPMCPTDSRPVNPTTRFRLTASMAQMAKTVPTVMANPTPCHSMNPMAHAMTNRFAHSWTLPFDDCQKLRGSRSRVAKSLKSCLFINNSFSLRERSTRLRTSTRHSRARGNPSPSWQHGSPYWTPAPYRSTGHAFAGVTKLLLTEFRTYLASEDADLLSGQQAIGPERQEEYEKDERNGVLPLSGQVPDAELLNQAQHESADYRAVYVSDAAHD